MTIVTKIGVPLACPWTPDVAAELGMPLTCDQLDAPTVVRERQVDWPNEPHPTVAICIEELGGTLPSGKAGALPDCDALDAAVAEAWAGLIDYLAPEAPDAPSALLSGPFASTTSGWGSASTAPGMPILWPIGGGENDRSGGYTEAPAGSETAPEAPAPIPLPPAGLCLALALVAIRIAVG